MGLSYETLEESAADRALQKTLVIALDAQRSSLRRDECGAWRIRGKHGHIYIWGPSGGWLIYCAAGTARKWNNLMSRLSSFCTVTQGGDDEGCFRLLQLPTAEQAIIIRKALGLKQKRMPNVGSFRSTAQENEPPAQAAE
jgi:hypothetical protein